MVLTDASFFVCIKTGFNVISTNPVPENTSSQDLNGIAFKVRGKVRDIVLENNRKTCSLRICRSQLRYQCTSLEPLIN